MKAQWTDIRVGQLLQCKVQHKSFFRYNQLAIVSSNKTGEFTVKWCNGDQSSDIVWYQPPQFEVIPTRAASRSNWLKGARVLCVFNNDKWGITATVAEDYKDSNNFLSIHWDNDPKRLDGSNWGALTSFVVFEQPIDEQVSIPNVPSAPPELLTKPFVSEPKIDWDAYNGFKRGPYIIR